METYRTRGGPKPLFGRGVIHEVFHPPLFSTPPWRPLNMGYHSDSIAILRDMGPLRFRDDNLYCHPTNKKMERRVWLAVGCLGEDRIPWRLFSSKPTFEKFLMPRQPKRILRCFWESSGKVLGRFWESVGKVPGKFRENSGNFGQIPGKFRANCGQIAEEDSGIGLALKFWQFRASSGNSGKVPLFPCLSRYGWNRAMSW